MALDLGIVLPLVRTRDNLDLPPHTYAVRVHGVEVGRGEAPSGAVLAIGDDLSVLPGLLTREPVFGLPAKWIPSELQQQAELMGCTVVDRASVITTHLSEVVRTNASRLLGREDRVYYPGHGEAVENPRRLVRGMLGHRKQREGQILRLLARGALSIPGMTVAMYAGLDPRLLPAAERSVLAHLLDLQRRGLVTEDEGQWSVVRG